MSSYANFQSDNVKYTVNRSEHNPEFNPTVEAKGEKEQGHLKDNLEKYVEFLSWAR